MKAPVIVQKHRQLIAWTISRLAEFPKDQHFLLADRIQRGLLDIQGGKGTRYLDWVP